MPQKPYLQYTEVALAGLQLEPCLPQPIEDLSQVSQMFGKRLAWDNKVVNIHQA